MKQKYQSFFSCMIAIFLLLSAACDNKDQSQATAEKNTRSSSKNNNKTKKNPNNSKKIKPKPKKSINFDQSFAKLKIKRQNPAKPAIDFNLEDLSGKKYKLSDFKGKIVFINFWATWCVPCIEEMPGMQKLYNKMQGKDFVMLVINSGESKEAVQAFMDKNKFSFPVLLDPDNAVSKKQYHIDAWPTTLIIDKQGRLIGKVKKKSIWNSTESFDLFTALTEQ